MMWTLPRPHASGSSTPLSSRIRQDRSEGVLATERGGRTVDSLRVHAWRQCTDLDSFGLWKFLRDNPIPMQPNEIGLVADVIRNSPPDPVMVGWGSGANSVRWVTEMRGTTTGLCPSNIPLAGIRYSSRPIGFSLREAFACPYPCAAPSLMPPNRLQNDPIEPSPIMLASQRRSRPKL
jgi:hypothetical protein